MQIDYVSSKATGAEKLAQSEAHVLRRALHAAYGAGRESHTDARAQLDAIAAPYLAHAEENNFPQEDYLVLRLADARRTQQAREQADRQALEKEEHFMVQTASHIRSARVLEIYLSRMRKRYRRLLQACKMTAREAEACEQKMCKRAIEACLAGLFSERKWALYLGVLRHFKNVLGERVSRACATSLRAGFAQDKGMAAWQATDENLPLSERRAGAWALLEEETDDELKAWARAQVQTLFERAETALSCARSNVYAQLADGQAADVCVLDTAEIPHALAAAACSVGEKQSEMPDVFNRLYFQGQARDIYKAYTAREIGAYDYLLLMRVYYARKGGVNDGETYALVQSLILFSEKNNVPAPAAEEVVYAVLHAPRETQYERAQTMKKIYLLQEFSK